MTLEVFHGHQKHLAQSNVPMVCSWSMEVNFCWWMMPQFGREGFLLIVNENRGGISLEARKDDLAKLAPIRMPGTEGVELESP